MFDFDNVGRGDKLVGVVDDHAVVGVFTDGAGVEDVLTSVNLVAGKCKSDDFEIVWVDDRGTDLTDGTAGLNTKDGGADKTRVIH